MIEFLSSIEGVILILLITDIKLIWGLERLDLDFIIAFYQCSDYNVYAERGGDV